MATHSQLTKTKQVEITTTSFSNRSMAAIIKSYDRKLTGRTFALITSPFLLAMALFVNYLRFNNYPLLTKETVICFIAIGLFCIIVGVAISRVRSWELQILFSFALFIVFIDSAISLEEKQKILSYIDSFNSKLLLLSIFIIIVFFTFLILLSLRVHLPKILFSSYSVFLVSSFLLPIYSMPFGLHSPANNHHQNITNNNPSTLHLLLDGHMGIDAIPTDINGGAELKARLIDFYTKWGFALHTQAFSQHVLTQDTVSTLFNSEMGVPPRELLGPGIGTRHRFTLIKNTYFDSRLENNIAVHVVQSDYLDYCSFKSNIQYCFTYPSVSLRGLTDVSLPSHLKARRLVRSYFNHSTFALFFENSFKSDKKKPGIRFNYFSLATHTAIDIAKQQLIKNPFNSLVFAHVLMPHAPYVWGRDCKIRTDNELWFPPLIGGGVISQDASTKRDEDYIEYFNQTHCMINILESTFTELSDQGMYKNINIVIHGDHGSRLPITPTTIHNVGSVEKRDILDSYSTLFAVRNSQSQPSIVAEQSSLIELFSTYEILSTHETTTPRFWFRDEDKPGAGNEIIEWQGIPFHEF